MKKFLIILLSLVLSVSMLAFVACSDTPADDDSQTGNEQTGDDGQDGTQPDGDDENADDDTTEAQSPHTAGDPDSDTLVVYFSWSSIRRRLREVVKMECSLAPWRVLGIDKCAALARAAAKHTPRRWIYRFHDGE